MTSGLEPSRVRIGSVYKDCINYQQYLYRSIFGCNVTTKARGIKEHRVKFKVHKDILDKLIYKIINLINSQNNRHKELFNKLDTRQIAKHILFRTILYYISYYTNNNKQFCSEAHFYASVVHTYYTTIERFYIRKYGKVSRIDLTRRQYLTSDKYAIIIEMNVVMGIVMDGL